jgi:hypothetical protein
MRCIRIIAAQTPASALGAASWHELTQVLDDAHDIGLVVYTHPLFGAPTDAITQLRARTKRVVVALNAGEESSDANGLPRTTRPVTEESLVMMARALIEPSTPEHGSFAPADFLQMLCSAGGSHVIVVNQDGSDVGVIEVQAGEVWTAFDALGVGEDAFARLMRPEMRARISGSNHQRGVPGRSGHPANGSRKERTITKGLHELLLDSFRRIDEGQVASLPPLSPAHVEAALSTPEQLAARVRQLNDEARRLLMARSYDEAARVLTWLSELDPDSHLVRANLDQLRRLGFTR